MAKKITEKNETKRLRLLFEDLPPEKFALAEGLIIQAARLRVRLNQLWEDIQEHGETDFFTQSDKVKPYEKERPASKLFNQTDKNYQTIIKQLVEMLPESQQSSKLDEFLNG